MNKPKHDKVYIAVGYDADTQYYVCSEYPEVSAKAAYNLLFRENQYDPIKSSIQVLELIFPAKPKIKPTIPKPISIFMSNE